MNKTLLKNIKIFETKTQKILNSSVLIKGEFIEDIFYGHTPPINCNLVDLKGYIAFPGFIDSHTHFKLKLEDNKFNSDDFISGSKSCISGGITTFIDFTDGDYIDCEKDLNKRIKEAKGSLCDYSFHFVLKNIKGKKDIDYRFKILNDIGAKSVKIFTTYKNRGLMSDEESMCFILQNAAKFDKVVLIHAESDSIINYNLCDNKYIKKISYHNIIRNEFSEVYEISKILKLNEKFRAKIYFVHISSAKSLEVINKYKESGFEVYAETCPQYILFDESVYKRKDNYLYTFTPPVRTLKNRIDMINNLKNFDVIASDSCAFNIEDKIKFKDNLQKIPMGVASTQLLFPILYTYGVKTKKIGFDRLISLLSANPANIFKLKNKGGLGKKFYADISIFSLDESFIVNHNNLSHKSDYSVYDGIKLYGKLKYLFLRGRLIFKEGKISNDFKGKFIC